MLGNFLYDWRVFFRPAALAWLNGQNPYYVPEFALPPWGLPLLAALAVLPEWIILVVNLAALAWVCWALRLKWWQVGLLISSPPVVYSIWWGNLDWLVIAAIVLPVGKTYLFSLKPQLGLVDLVDWRRLLVLGLIALPFVSLWDDWLLALGELGKIRNMSLLPWSLLPGLFLWTRAPMVASILLSPHVSFGSLSAVSLWLVRRWPGILLVVNLVVWAVLIVW